MAKSFKIGNIVPQTRYLSTDGKGYTNPNTARVAQFEIDFDSWYEDPENAIRNLEARVVRRWIIDHASDISSMMKVLGAE